MALRIGTIAVSFIITMIFATKVLQWIMIMSYKRHYFDSHNERKIHTGNVPRLGGIMFFPVTVLMMIATAVVAMQLLEYANLPQDISYALGLLGAMFIMFIFGLVDDMKGMEYRTKFLSQIAAGLLLCLSGVWLQDLGGLFGIHALSPWVGWPLTIFAIIFVINSINFADGIDGLAGSLSVLGLCYYGFFNYKLGNVLLALISVILIGCLLPYLYYNLTGSAKGHNKIFMGDTGSTTLGVTLISLGIIIVNSATKQIANLPEGETSVVHPMMLGLAPLVYPCYDTVRVVIHRLKNHKSPFVADTNHFHHKMLALGMSQRRALMTINAINITLIIAMIYASGVIGITWVLIGSLVLWTLCNALLTKKIKGKTTIQNDEN